MAKQKRRIPKTTISVNREQHQRYRALLARTGLYQPVFMDRLLQLGEERIAELLVLDDDGVRAAM